MPSYQYEAVNRKGRLEKNIIWASSKQKAISELRADGMTVRRLEEKRSSILTRDLPLFNRISRKEFVLFCRQFATMIRSGIQIEQALKLLVNQTKVKPVKQALSAVLDRLRSGKQLSEALALRPRDFPRMFVSMIGSGEVGGNLDDILESMAEHYEKEEKSLHKIRSALMYPALVLVIAAGVVVFLMNSIVPTFKDLFEEQGAELPFITKWVVSVSEGMRMYWYIPLLLLLLTLVTGRMVLASKAGKYALDLLKYQLPFFGALLKKSTLARMARTMAALFYGGIPVMQILTVSETIIENRVATRLLAEARLKLEDGKLLSEPFRDSGFFPELFIQMIQIGEETGQMDTMLHKIADYYEADVERMVDRIKTLIEPALMLGLTFIVGIIVTAIITPMFSLYEQIIQ